MLFRSIGGDGGGAGNNWASGYRQGAGKQYKSNPAFTFHTQILSNDTRLFVRSMFSILVRHLDQPPIQYMAILYALTHWNENLPRNSIDT